MHAATTTTHIVDSSKTKMLLNKKGPSPRSVTAISSVMSSDLKPHTTSFEDEPFDCAVNIRTRRTTVVENTIVTISPLVNDSLQPTSTLHQHPKKCIGLPKSSSSHSSSNSKKFNKKESSFKLRRMQLTQQRKWKEEYIERTVQSKSRGRSTRESDDEYSLGSQSNSSLAAGALGKEILIEHEDGLEISIANHLQKTGFNSSLIPTVVRYDLPHPDTEKMDCQETNCHDDCSIDLETVSSLNSSHYESEDLMSKCDSKAGKVKKTSKIIQHNVHPPLYVSSVKKQKKKNNRTYGQSCFYEDDMEVSTEINPSGQDYEESDYVSMNESTMERQLLGDLIGSDLQNKSDRCPFNTSNSTANDIDKTALVSNKELATTQQNKENDIPWHAPKYANIESRKEALREVSRERPIKSQMLNNSNETKPESSSDVLCSEPPSISSNKKSPNTLRRRRLQSSLFVPYDSQKETDNKNFDEEAINEFPTNTQIHIDIVDDDNNEPEAHSDNEVISKDDGMSIKSATSTQTYATLRTCMSVRPSSEDEMERMLKSKQTKIFNIHHALTCTYPHASDPDDESYIPCPDVHYCQALSSLVKHVQTCTYVNGNGNECIVPGCTEYKKMWYHYRRCMLRTFTVDDTKKCRLCCNLWGRVKGNELKREEGEI